MRYVSQANRGKPFESLIRFANDRYRMKRVAVIDKQYVEMLPIRDKKGKIVSCKIGEKSTVDFLGRVLHVPIAIEAKETNDKSIRFDRIEPHQADYMDEFTEEPGTIGLVLVSFGQKRYFAIPWAVWSAAYNARVRPGASKSAPATVTAFGTTWDIPKKASVNMDEIPPEYEIPSHDTVYGFHYLKNAHKYITPRKELQEVTVNGEKE